MKPIYSGLVACLAIVATLGAQDAPPRFRARVDVQPIDVTVVDNDGRQVRDLTAADFAVSVGGTARRVLSAEWIPLTGGPAVAAVPVPEGYSSNENATGGGGGVPPPPPPQNKGGGGGGPPNPEEGLLPPLFSSRRLGPLALGGG